MSLKARFRQPALIALALALAAVAWLPGRAGAEVDAVSWGLSAFDQGDPRERYSQVAAGSSHTVALKSDGNVIAWGNNQYGQCTVPDGLSGVSQIAVGAGSTVALKNDGTVIAWGNNQYGQCTVPSGLSGVTKIAGGDYHTVALKNDGTMVAWGSNTDGQCTVPTGLSRLTEIAVGDRHTVVLKNDGNVIAWGYNYFGQCTVPTGLSGVTQIAAGSDHTVVLKNDGNVVAWGDNQYGQCTVPDGLSGVTQIVGGRYFNTVALVTFADCNGNGQRDSYEMGKGWAADTNANGSIDTCDMADGDLDLSGMIDTADLSPAAARLRPLPRLPWRLRRRWRGDVRRYRVAAAELRAGGLNRALRGTQAAPITRKRAKGFEPSTFSLGITIPGPA